MNKTNITFIIILLLILGGGYFTFKSFKNEIPVLNEQFAEKEIARKDFLKLVNKLKEISVDIDFFSNEKFTELKDLSVTIELPEKTGRLNPFLPF